MIKSQTFKNPKIIIPGVLGIVLLTVVLTMFNPMSAIAQIATTDSSVNQKPVITGSVNVKDTIKNFINDNKKVSFSDAAATAEKQVENGSVIGGHVGIEQGYLVYTFFVIDTKNDTGYKIVIDAGNGSVLNKSEGKPLKSFGDMPFGPMGMHEFGQHGMHDFGSPGMNECGDKNMMHHQGFDESSIPTSSP